ncbi:MAG: hypothetical protein Q9168_007356, partial [Polycauliona sp. 1 TL-2023]
MREDEVPFLAESMTSRLKAVWSEKNTSTDRTGDSGELALENLSPSHDLDDANLLAQGHEASLQRSFSPLAAVGLGFSITNSWVGYLSNFGQNLIYGGPQNVVFGLLVATAVQWTITLGLSEIASAFPSAGGQYHFTYILAPTKHKKFAAFVVGWMTVLGWWVVTCSGVSLCAVSVAGLVHLWHPAFEASPWQIYLIYLASIFLTAAPLFLSPKYAYGGTDGAIHIAEEIPRPSKNIPKAMNLTMAIGFLTAFPMSLALMFGITDIDAVLNSDLASAEIFYQITGSKGIVTFMMGW